ncbi:MAG: (Cytosine-5-)-methyltransferase protein [Candidatus Magasanikbacteria bacterium GW2011_GWA2_42_32]|uniref:Methyltransferase n=1 Tax=Candidatus Magasanikbacteria bacterium GW2011_GWA2_42_32 TaxID=1619039 RepID=A0A0G1A6A5_9BACT|nr:MAG: (Cytosine-5-)-methyltransferase protein [Candidatus Magasanikbacteria bacterium GW2011_GWA2_42_32]HBX15890.1 DNA modification methylase [Candidatus Magasanikbacteria bacterium]
MAEIINIKINELKPADYNPRQMTEKQARDLTESIKKFGLVDPIIVNSHPGRENVVIGGHQRLKIASNLGFTEVPVVYVDLDENREKELNLRLNRNTGEWDWDLLANFDKNLLLEIGFESQELDKGFGLGEVEEDNFDAQAEHDKIIEPQAKLGDLYQLGEHRLLCGDSTKLEDFEKLMNGQKAHLIFTDPPYNVDYKSASGIAISAGKYGNGNKIFNDNKSNEDCLQFYIDVLKNLYLHSMDDCCIYWWLAFNSNGLINLLAFKESGWKMSQQLTWVKECMVFSRGQDYHRMCEPCFFGWKQDKTHFRNKKICDYKDVFNLDYDSFQELPDIWFEKRDKTAEYVHPTQKPVRLAERALKKSSVAGDIVLESFGGSGSTLMACEQLNRKCYAMELDPKYVDVIIKRWEQFTGDKAIKIS